MFAKKNMSCLYLLMLVSLLPVPQTDAFEGYISESEKMFMTALGVAAIAAGTYAVGYGLGWWGYESHEQLIERTQKHINELSSYLPMTGLINVAGPYFEPQFTLNEELLYHLAFIKRGDVAIDDFVISLRCALKDTSILHQIVAKRSTYLKNENNWPDNRITCYQLDELHARLYKATQELETLLIMLEKHISYFKLFEYEDYARNQYASELQLLDKFTQINTFREALRASIWGKNNRPFSFIEFMHELQRDIKSMNELILQVTYNYATRIGYARDLVNRLHHIEQIIIHDPEYQYMLLEYQKEQYEREQMLLERHGVRQKKDETMAPVAEVNA